jgi:hypothetical protein
VKLGLIEMTLATVGWLPAAYDFCTLFDSRYLPRALALYRSLEEECDDFTLRAVCMDEESRLLMEALTLPKLRLISIGDVERWDPGLRAVRPTRSSTEYCWTSTPAICRFALHEEPELDTLTYLDADLCFFGSPAPMYDELGDGSILLVPHRATEADDAMGVYNVGWVTFRNDATGNAALDWWRNRCLEWCYARIEPGRYGDQKYLDDWPARFSGVRVSTHPGAGMLSWDAPSHALTSPGPGELLVDGRPLIFHHHEGLHLHPETRTSTALAGLTRVYRESGRAEPRFVWTALGLPSEALVDLVWNPYVRRLVDAFRELAAVGAPPQIGLTQLRLRLALGQVMRQALPPALFRPYRRLPVALRNRVWRALSSSPPSGAS